MLTFLPQTGLLGIQESEGFISVPQGMTPAAAKQLSVGRKQDCSARRRKDLRMASEMEETRESHLQERSGLFSKVMGGRTPGWTCVHATW